jgi:WD40 repeat protein/serine/threonine protein kinase
MASHLTCPEGHQWDEPSDRHRQSPDQRPTCPVCGMGGSPRAATPPTFRLGAAPPAPLLGRWGAFSRARFGTFPGGGPPPVPGYEILEELGRGGMGVVYKARQTALDRLVALKMIVPARASTEDLERFRREARAVAALQHPNIIQIYEVGDRDGLPYFSLEFAAGGNLADRLAGKPQPPAASAALVETVARAIHYAHEHGFVHRDLKPSNILLQEIHHKDPKDIKDTKDTKDNEKGQPKDKPAFGPSGPLCLGGESFFPKIGDFGLVRRFGPARAGGEATLTGADEMLGTPAYMAPEQVRGRSQDLGPAVDVYALGVILFEMLTGRPPFNAGDPFETMLLLTEQEPVPPRTLQPKVPPDLETICLKCLEKEPLRRYPSAAALADDLRRFQAGEPILARPTPAWERAWKWVRRRPALAALSAAVVLVTVVAFAGISAALFRAHDEWQRAEGKARDEAAARQVAEEHERQADEQRLSALRGRADAVLDIGINLCERGNSGNGLLWLAQALKLATEAKDEPLQRVARVNLASWGERHVRPGFFFPHKEWVWAGAISPDGKTAVTASRDKTARLWDTQTGEPLGEPLTHEYPVWAVAFHPDGRLVLTGCGTPDGKAGAVRLWDARTGKAVTPPLSQPAQVGDVRFAPDGQSFLVVCANLVEVYRTAAAVAGPPEGVRPLSLGHPKAPVLAAAYSPDGRAILTGTGVFALDPKTGAPVPAEGGAHLWDTGTGRPVGAVLPHAAPVQAVAFSPDGKTFATGSWDGNVRLWQTESRQPLGQPLPHRGGIKAVVFSPDGRLLASGGLVLDKNARTQASEISGGETRLWEVATGQALGEPLRHHLPVWSLAFHPNGRILLSGSEDGRARFWHVGTGGLLGERMLFGTVRFVTFSPDGRLALAGCAGGGLQGCLFEVSAGRGRAGAFRAGGDVKTLAWSRDGQALATGADLDGVDRGGAVCLWDAATGKRLAELLRGASNLKAVRFGADDRTVLASVGGKVLVWQRQTGQALPPLLDGDNGIGPLAVSGDGQQLLTAKNYRGSPALLWRRDVRGQFGRQPLEHLGSTVSLAFSPDGRSALVGSLGAPAQARLYDTSTGKVVRIWPHQQDINAVAFSPDGRLVLTGSSDMTAQLWDATTGRPTPPPLLHSTAVAAAAFAPDGRTVATADAGGVLRVWDVATGKPLSPPLHHQAPVSELAYRPDSLAVAAGGANKQVTLWEVPPPLGGEADRVLTWAEVLTGATIDEQRLIQKLEKADLADRRRLLEGMGGPPTAAWPAGVFRPEAAEQNNNAKAD